MGEQTLFSKIIEIPYRIKTWFICSLCEHDFEWVFKEKGWFGTGHLSGVISCNKCGVTSSIKMEFPPQIDL